MLSNRTCVGVRRSLRNGNQSAVIKRGMGSYTAMTMKILKYIMFRKAVDWSIDISFA
jgi:hypothetical protein